MIELFIAFGAGLISFLSPCVLPLIPGYVSFISGNTLNEILEKKKIDLLPLIVFSLGFSFVFIIFGATASFLGKILLQNNSKELTHRLFGQIKSILRELSGRRSDARLTDLAYKIISLRGSIDERVIKFLNCALA